MGRNFDLFIQHKNKLPENIRRYITRARLFEFNVFPTETMDSEYLEDIEELAYNFCLPFPVVAVEDKTSCVILWDQEKNAVGLEHQRHMMEISSTENYLEEKSFKLSSQDKMRGITQEDQERSREGLRQVKKQFGEYPLMVRWGTAQIKWLPDVKKWSGEGKVGGALYCLIKQDKIIDLLEVSKREQGMASALDLDYMRGCITAYEELLRMSMKTLFIKETRPKKRIKGKYLKTHERPVYTVVRPDVARKSMGLECQDKRKKGTIKERRAHIRREHTRELRSEVFKNKQGQTVQVKRSYIPATWEGPSESEDNKHYYKVILDLPKGLRDTCS